MKKLALLMLGLCYVSPVYAAKLSGWEISLAPYLWALGMNGDVQIANLSAPVSEPFSQLMKNLRGGGIVYLDVKKDRFGIYVNGLYASLSNDTTVEPTTIRTTSNYGLLGAGISYRISGSIEPYIGIRYTSTQAAINIVNTSISYANNETWTDPVIGTRLIFDSKCHWSMIFAGDVGGTNFNDHKSYDLNAYIGYKPSARSKLFTLYLGYRILYQHYVTCTGSSYFAWKMHLSGPVLGFALRF